jgi:hypothetical protein
MFGKILVCTHLGLSLILATWALVIFTNRVDWTSAKGKEGKPDGLVKTRMEEYDKAAKEGSRPADQRWRTAREQLESHEDERPRDRAWYVLQLKFLDTGATKDNPVRQVDRGPNGPIVLAKPAGGGDRLQMGAIRDDKDRPVNGPDGKPLVLRAQVFYNEAFDASLQEELDLLTKRRQAGERDTVATRRLIGDKDKGLIGLHDRLRHEKVKQERLRDEYSEVRPLWLNTMVEYQNLAELQLRLDKRRAELKNLKTRGDREGP